MTTRTAPATFDSPCAKCGQPIPITAKITILDITTTRTPHGYGREAVLAHRRCPITLTARGQLARRILSGLTRICVYAAVTFLMIRVVTWGP